MGRLRAPTREQAAVIRLEQGPARVLAGAGSGKTHTMTELVSYRVDEHLRRLGGTAPERILALTFTVKAADEMRSRLISRLGEQGLKLTVSNFHSYALEIVRENAAVLGLEPDAPVLRRGRAWLMVLDELAADDLALRRLDLSDPAGAADKVLTLLSRAKNELMDLKVLRSRTEEDLFRAGSDELARVFEERLDLIELGAHVLEDPVLGEAYRDRYEFVMVDEFQDTNPAQLRFVSDHLRLAASPGHARESLLRLLSRAPSLLDPNDLRAFFSAPGGPEAALRAPETVPDLSPVASERLENLSHVLARLEAEMSEADSLGAFVERTVEVTGLGHELRSSAEPEAALQFLGIFRDVAGEFGGVRFLG